MRPALGRFRLLLCLLLLVSIIGYTGGSGSASVNSNADIDELIQRYVERSMARDAQGLADLFTDPAQWTDPTGVQSLTRAQIKTQFDAMYAIVTTIYDMDVGGVSVTVSGNTATVQFSWSQDVENAFLGRVQSAGSMTWQLQRIAGMWYIAHAQTEIDH